MDGKICTTGPTDLLAVKQLIQILLCRFQVLTAVTMRTIISWDMMYIPVQFKDISVEHTGSSVEQ
jgi:hypothetical protein